MDEPFAGMPVEVGPGRWETLVGEPILLPGLGRAWGTLSRQPVLAKLDVTGKLVWSYVTLTDVNRLVDLFPPPRRPLTPWTTYATPHHL